MNEIIRLEPYSQIRHGGIASLVVDQGPLGVTVMREVDGNVAFDELTCDEINDGLRTGQIVVRDGYHSEEAARQEKCHSAGKAGVSAGQCLSGGPWPAGFGCPVRK